MYKDSKTSLQELDSSNYRLQRKIQMLSPICSLSCSELCALAVGLITRRDSVGMVSSIVVSHPNHKRTLWFESLSQTMSEIFKVLLFPVCYFNGFQTKPLCIVGFCSIYFLFFPRDIFRDGLILAQSPVTLIPPDTIGNHVVLWAKSSN